MIRTAAGEVKLSGRQTMGVRLMNLAAGDSVVAIARNAETAAEDGADPDDNGAGPEGNGAGPDGSGSGQEATE